MRIEFAGSFLQVGPAPGVFPFATMKIEEFDKSREVAESLSKAWEFLSGEREIYDVHLEQAEIPKFADYSVFLPLSVDSRTAGVGVLIHREDATVVASHM